MSTEDQLSQQITEKFQKDKKIQVQKSSFKMMYKILSKDFLFLETKIMKAILTKQLMKKSNQMKH